MQISIKKTLQIAASFLRVFENPKLEAEVLLGSLLGKERAWIKSHDEDGLSCVRAVKFTWWTLQRRLGRPLAYIRGYQDWHGHKFIVNRHVLIPRDETETLLRHIISSWKLEGRDPVSILDVGTGSGCLAIELKRVFQKAEVTALDISKKALGVAHRNANKQSQLVNFKHSDLLQVIADGSHFDIIVANLPYVPESIVVTKEVKQEPHSAIFSGADGFEHLRRFEQELVKLTFGELWLEFLPTQKEGISEIFKNYTVEFKGDVAGNLFFAKVTQ